MNPRFWGMREAAVIGLALLALGVIHVSIPWITADQGRQLLEDRVLFDPDSYMWMNRVIHIAESGEWFEHRNPRINPPEGHQQHWTRPLDGILLGGGVALGLIWGFRDALYLWGFALSPLLHLVTLLGLVWAVRVLIDRRILPAPRIPLLILVFLAQVPLYHTFLAGRPDHHALMGLLFVLYLGFWMRILLNPERSTGAAVGLGVVSALSIWVSVEALLYVVIGMSGLGLGWLLGNLRLGRDGAVHALALVAGLAAAILVEWGARSPPVREMDTLSIAHLVLMGLAAGFWILLWGVTGRDRTEHFRARLLIAGTGAAVVLVGLAGLFPEFFGNPLGEVDPLYRESRLIHIRELQSLPSLGEGFRGGFGAVLLYAGIGVVALPYLVWRTWKSRKSEWAVLWSGFAVAVAIYLALSLEQRRWTDYLALSAVIPYVLLASTALGSMEGRLEGISLRVVRLFLLLGFVVGPNLLGFGLVASAERTSLVEEPAPAYLEGWVSDQEGSTLEVEAGETVKEDGSCSLVEVGRILSDSEWFPEPELVLAHTDYGPALMFWTHHSVLSIPNHRAQPGYRFTHEVLRHSNPGAAAQMLKERGVGVLVICAHDISSGFFRYPEVESPFVNWLAQGGVPDGYALHVATPAARIYRRSDHEGG